MCMPDCSVDQGKTYRQQHIKDLDKGLCAALSLSPFLVHCLMTCGWWWCWITKRPACHNLLSSMHLHNNVSQFNCKKSGQSETRAILHNGFCSRVHDCNSRSRKDKKTTQQWVRARQEVKGMIRRRGLKTSTYTTIYEILQNCFAAQSKDAW